MKKFFLLVVAMVGLMAAQAQHVEFKWHRMYGVAGYEFNTNINTTNFNDKVTLHGIYAVGGWQIRKESGIGIGASYMFDPTGAFTQLPVFMEVRSHYLRNRITPFTTFQVGYSIPLGTSSTGDNRITIAKGGPTWGFNVGARFAYTRKMGFSAYLGYQGIFLQRVDRYEDSQLAYGEPLLLHNFKFGVGFHF
ncbi:MAG: hypothetical protein MJZ67_04490 [Bacteroidales bacterium]|nr:hypothetical protein [Bacteroidales bacterium]